MSVRGGVGIGFDETSISHSRIAKNEISPYFDTGLGMTGPITAGERERDLAKARGKEIERMRYSGWKGS